MTEKGKISGNVAILTWKSFVILGCMDEQLIEPSSSWFKLKFSLMIVGVAQIYQVRRMISGIGNVLFSTCSVTPDGEDPVVTLVHLWGKR